VSAAALLVCFCWADAWDEFSCRVLVCWVELCWPELW